MGRRARAGMRLTGAELVRRLSCRCRAVTTKQRVSRPDGMSLSARAMSLSTITERGQEPEMIANHTGHDSDYIREFLKDGTGSV